MSFDESADYEWRTYGSAYSNRHDDRHEVVRQSHSSGEPGRWATEEHKVKLGSLRRIRSNPQAMGEPRRYERLFPYLKPSLFGYVYIISAIWDIFLGRCRSSSRYPANSSIGTSSVGIAEAEGNTEQLACAEQLKFCLK